MQRSVRRSWRIVRVAFCTCAVAAGSTSAPSAQQERCTCKHLRALESARAQAEAARDVYREQAEELRRQEQRIYPPRALEDFEAAERLRQAYKSWRENDFAAAFARRAGAAQGRNATARDVTQVTFDARSCEADTNELFKAMQEAPCYEAATILSHHEDYHSDVCWARQARRTQFAPPPRRTTPSIEQALDLQLKRLPSGDALDEVGAYTLEVTEYDALIAKLMRDIQGVDYRVNYKGKGGAGAMSWSITGFVPLTVAEGPLPAAVSGQATATLKGTLSSPTCPGTASPAEIPLAVSGTLSANGLRLTFDNKTVTKWDLRCKGAPAVSFPYWMVPGLNDVRFEFKPGATVVNETPLIGATSGGWRLTLRACTTE